MESALNYIAKAFILPPGCFFSVLISAFILRRRLPRISLGIAVFAVVGMYLMSTAWFEKQLVHQLVDCRPYQPAIQRAEHPEMIVVLAAERYENAPEYGGVDRVGLNTLSRLRYAVKLQRRTGLPLLVSGGAVFEDREPLAELMKTCLIEFFAVDPAIISVESKSRNTRENAQYSKAILDARGINTIMLVTGSLHIKRAANAFRREHLKVIPAPTHFVTFGGAMDRGLWAWLPRNRKVSYDAVHELIGGLWYRIRSGELW